ncbi:protein translocase subunit SecF [Candidatus Parcubacteria bacterium]|nr:MAG: protein translocase subunit SecF [Candidatus Parcubacteria bacterium]
MINVVGKRKIYFTISGALVAASLISIAIFGFRQGIDFAGGSLWRFRASEDVSLENLDRVFRINVGVSDIRLNYDSANRIYLGRLGAISEETHRQYLSVVKREIPSFDELSFESIGPSIGRELRKNAFIAVALVLVGISLYIAFVFRKTSQPVSSWKYGWITLLTLFHDVVIPAGLFAALGRYLGVEVDTNFIVALLVVMGFSVHDTIVVFDRIRENLALARGKFEFGTLINESVNKTMARSINTSLTLILVLIALYFVGPVSLQYFILTLLVGVTTGIYSSIFLASPALLLVSPKGVR